MLPAAIALKYSAKNIWNDIRQIIVGASMSESNTSELNLYLAYIVLQAACVWTIRFSYNLISLAASLAFDS